MAPKFQYSEASMKTAMEAVAKGMSHTTAARKFGVPRTTLRNNISGKSPLRRKMGPISILKPNEEYELERWIVLVRLAEFSVTKDQLLDSVQMLVKDSKRDTPFTDGRPGRKWYALFLKRHASISTKSLQHITPPLKTSISEESIRSWFEKIRTYLQMCGNSNILTDPNRLFNCDEAAFFLSTKKDKVIKKKGSESVQWLIGNKEKEYILILVTGNAAGILAPPMVVLKRITHLVASSVPSTWKIGYSENGCITSVHFFEYITNVFHPWLILQNIPLPIILFLDGPSSHLTLPLFKFCEEKGIILVSLYPRTTHLPQPIESAVFHPMKVLWKKAIEQWCTKNQHEKLINTEFCPFLKKAFDSISPSNLTKGFRKCGLAPFLPDVIDFSKIKQSSFPRKGSIEEEQ